MTEGQVIRIVATGLSRMPGSGNGHQGDAKDECCGFDPVGESGRNALPCKYMSPFAPCVADDFTTCRPTRTNSLSSGLEQPSGTHAQHPANSSVNPSTRGLLTIRFYTSKRA
jgi:hypothetical protein